MGHAENCSHECDCFCHQKGMTAMHIMACCEGKCKDCGKYIQDGKMADHLKQCHQKTEGKNRAIHLPKFPKSIAMLAEGEQTDAAVFGGLSMIGAAGIMCQTVSIISGDEKGAWGWSKSIGDPAHPNSELYYFSTKEKTNRGMEIPNMMIFFQAKLTDRSLLTSDADKKLIDEIIEYVMPHICDDGPPPPHPDDR